MKSLAVMNLILRVSGLVLLFVALMGLREWSGETPGILHQLGGSLEAARGITLACAVVGVTDLWIPLLLNRLYERAKAKAGDSGQWPSE